MARISGRASAKVRIDDPREDKARKNDYTDEQFQTLFRPMIDPVYPATGGRIHPYAQGMNA